MNIKPIYIYTALFALIVILIVIFSGSDEKEKLATDNSVPNDEIHNNLKPGSGMGMGSVSGTAKRKLEELRVSYESNPSDTSNAKEYADMLNAAHQPQKALEIYEKILEIDSKRVDILLGSTFAFYNMNDLDNAEEYTKRVLVIDKDNHEANFNLGAIAAAKGEKEKAREYWNDVIKRFPNSQAAKIAASSIQKL